MGDWLHRVLGQIGSSSFLQARRTTIKAPMSLNFGKIPSLTSELSDQNSGFHGNR